MKVVVRRMDEKDARAYLETHRASATGVLSADYPPEVIAAWDRPITDQSVAAFLDNPDGEICVVAELGGEIVGIGSVVPHLEQLRACYVAPKGLRQGVGTAIVRRLETIAREHGVDRLELHATTTAEPFYQHLGYVSEGRVTHRSSSGVEMDAVLMTKEHLTRCCTRTEVQWRN
jgi:GNAT superfamily N-acetyltransferase